ncbi:MAG: hypothetical protein J0M36_07090 [Caulobacterales bacterium]|nr:hypothetical protein [Caulobacterales bacterium]
MDWDTRRRIEEEERVRVMTRDRARLRQRYREDDAEELLGRAGGIFPYLVAATLTGGLVGLVIGIGMLFSGQGLKDAGTAVLGCAIIGFVWGLAKLSRT